MPSLAQIKSAVSGLSRFSKPSSISSSTAKHLDRLGVDYRSVGIGVTNPSAQQESILRSLPDKLIPTGYKDLKELGTLEQATVNVLAGLGISPITSDKTSNNIIKKFNDLQTERARLDIKIDELKKMTEGRSPDRNAYDQMVSEKEKLDQVEKDLSMLDVSRQEKSTLEGIWSDFLLPTAHAQEDLTPTLTTVKSLSRVPGQERSEAGAGVVVPVEEQKPQTDIFGNVVSYQLPLTVEGTRGQVRYTTPDPSTNSGLVYNPFSEVGEVIYETMTDILDIPTEPSFIPPSEPSFVPPQQEPVKCPARVQIVSNITNVVAGEGEFNCDTIEKYHADPDYRIVYLENGFIPTQEPEPEVTTEYVPPPEPEVPMVTVTPDVLTWYYVKKPSGICERLNVSQKFVNQMTSQGWIFSLTDICEPEPTTAHIPPPDMPVEEPPITVTPTEPGQVNWIPEPFFSFINNVFKI